LVVDTIQRRVDIFNNNIEKNLIPVKNLFFDLKFSEEFSKNNLSENIKFTDEN
jgi:hypothetical protein